MSEDAKLLIALGVSLFVAFALWSVLLLCLVRAAKRIRQEATDKVEEFDRQLRQVLCNLQMAMLEADERPEDKDNE